MKQQAELLKRKFGSALAYEMKENEIVCIPGLRGREPKEISLKNLANIIQARVEEIIELVHHEIKNSGYERKLITGIVLTGGITYLSKQWYSDKKRVPFHFYNDLRGWNQVDKFGHFYASYIESDIGYSLMKKFNFSEKKALYLGGFQGLILETPIEIFDAYYDGWGFSLSDMVANAAGSLFFIFQQKIFKEQIIKPKLSFSVMHISYLLV